MLCIGLVVYKLYIYFRLTTNRIEKLATWKQGWKDGVNHQFLNVTPALAVVLSNFQSQIAGRFTSMALK